MRKASRTFHRAGVIALMFVATAILIIESCMRMLSRVTHLIVIWLGLSRIEPWLKRRSLWFAAPLLLMSVALFFFCEFGQYVFFAYGHYFVGIALHFLKWAAFPITSYLLGLYEDKLMSIGWFNVAYTWYLRKKKLLFSWIHSQEWYKSAAAFMAALKYELVAVLTRLRVKISIYGRRRTSMHAAKRVRDIRVRNGKCVTI